MSTLQLSDTLLNGYITLFSQLGQQDQTVLMDRLMESMRKDVAVSEDRSEDSYFLPKPTNPKSFERLADPSGVEAARQIFGAWSAEEDNEDVAQMIQAIKENRTLEREVNI